MIVGYLFFKTNTTRYISAGVATNLRTFPPADAQGPGRLASNIPDLEVRLEYLDWVRYTLGSRGV